MLKKNLIVKTTLESKLTQKRTFLRLNRITTTI